MAGACDLQPKIPPGFQYLEKQKSSSLSDSYSCTRNLSHHGEKGKADEEKHSRVFGPGSAFRRLPAGTPGVAADFHGALGRFWS